MEWLGYIVTPDGLKPKPKKVRIQRPRNAGELRSFLGLVNLVNFYRDLFPRVGLQSFYDLTNSTDKRTVVIPWTAAHDRAFRELKAVVAKDAIMAFPIIDGLFTSTQMLRINSSELALCRTVGLLRIIARN